MNQKFTLIFLLTCCFLFSTNAQFRPVSISGFNADIIANGTGDASTSTNAGADAGPYAFVSADFVSGTGTTPTFSLPVSGLINSAATPGLSFQLNNYSLNNTCRLSTATSTNETLTVDTPQNAAEVYLLAYSGSGSSTADITLNFSDGTSQTASFTVADWYNGTPFVLQGIGRVNTTDNTFSGTSTNPRLYSLRFVVDYANFGKNIISLNISKTNTTTSVLGVLAMSTLKINPNYTPIPLTGFNADVIAEGMGDPNFSTTSDVDGATPPYAFVAADYQYTSSCAFPVRNLPLTGFISSSAVPGMSYLLAPYAANNDLRLAGTDAGTLTLATPTESKTVYLLGVGGNGSAKVSATVTFSDNSTQFFDNLTLSDWYGGTTGIVTSGIGRIMKTTTSCGGLETSATSPKLYQIPLALDTANYAKAVASITVTRIDGVTGFTGIANILAVTIENTFTLLPVKLAELKGSRTDAGNRLEWKTASENNNKGFEVEKSANGASFSTIGFVKSKTESGNNTSELNYSFIDPRSVPEANCYYRLKQIDKDGKVTFSNTVLIDGVKPAAIKLLSLYPNPVMDQCVISLTAPSNEIATVIVTDALGSVILEKSLQVKSGCNNYQISFNSLKSGTYFLKINTSKNYGPIFTRFVKL